MPPGSASPPRQLLTERLLLRASAPELSDAVREFQFRNHAHFAPWDPPRPADFWDPDVLRARLARESADFDDGRLWRFWFCLQDQPTRVIGQVQISQIARGPFQSALLGYSLDAALQRRGLMDEALRGLIDELFGPRVWLHRLQASVRPDNMPSRRVLERLGFRREGLSPRYLFIDGAWRDHETHALINPAWPERLPPPV